MLQIIDGHEGPILLKVTTQHPPPEDRQYFRVQEFGRNRRVGLN